MTQSVIQVDRISKQYQLGLRAKAQQTFREAVVELAQAPFKRLRHLSGRSHADDTFWALRDISFDVPEGEVLGVIGHNGAGKSTLLKILSRITEPTTGRAVVYGRVASLLEVGTGFHPELTGRENVYLNGAILGMSREEIRRKFDEIVEFAGVDKFLDTPIKRYSSGMKVRLAFAVAAHLEPEILIIDEVLAVGDQEFQNKCLGKMNEVAHSGRTVLFVSHNMAAVEALCQRCLLLSQGTIIADAPTGPVLEQYCREAFGDDDPRINLLNHSGRQRGCPALMQSVCVTDAEGGLTSTFEMGETIRIQVEFDASGREINPVLGVVVKTQRGVALFGNDNRIVDGYNFPLVTGDGQITCAFASLPLMPGRYSLDLWFGDSQRSLDCVTHAVTIQIVAANVTGTGKLPPANCGPVYWPATWELDVTECVGP